MNKLKYFLLLQLISLFMLSRAYGANAPAENSTSASDPIENSTPASAAIAPLVESSAQPMGLRAKVTAVRQTVLSSQMPGHIAKLAVHDGDVFARGQLLVKMDCSVPASQLRRAEAAVQKNAALYSTTKKLAQLNSRSQLELSVAKAEADQATAEAAIARTAVERCEIHAPFAGRVAERLAQENQFVNEGQPLLEILDPGELELEFIVPSIWLAWFTPGYEFDVHIDETQSILKAKLARLSGKVDAVSQSIKAYAVFTSSDPKLLPGMSGEALISPLAPPAALAPLPALPTKGQTE